MLPTIKSGQHVIASKLSNVKPGDIVLVHFVSRNRNDYFIKRLIATEGQSVKIHNGVIYINNVSRNFGPNIIWTKNNNFDLKGESLVIPKGYVFVLGDDKNNSKDSRELGLAIIVAKVIFIY